MTAPNSTIRKLAEITDPALFERLATDVLRASKPSIYENLSHCGVNTDGKTVKAPLDGIGWVRDAGGDRFVGAAHSTEKQSDIQKKWLHDPSTVKVRKAGGKPTAPEGDLRKAVREISTLRANQLDLKATFAITSNREPDQATRVAAESLASSANIDIDIWSASRIAHFLDSPDGQWIRKMYLGDPVEFISTELLRSCTQARLNEYARFLNPKELVDRTDIVTQSYGHSLLLGPSGVGKTTVALQILKHHADNGGFGLIIPHETVDRVTTLAEAIDVELRKLEPYLLPNSGHKALSLTTADLPFIVVIEDANAASDPPKIFNKVVGWGLGDQNDASSNHWRLLCPIWPRYIDSLNQKLKGVHGIAWQTIDTYTDEQAEEAIRKRSQEAGHNLLPATTAAIAKALGNDPLLIALCDFSSTPDPVGIIEAYVEKELAMVAANSNNLHQTEIAEAVESLICHMLKNRRLDPTLKEIKTWFRQNTELLEALRLVFKSGSVLRLTHRNDEDVLTSRHDLVLLSLLGFSIGNDLKKNVLDDDCLGDPFFAEAIGLAVVSRQPGIEILDRIMQVNPLSLFHAFHFATRTNSQSLQVIVDVISAWLAKPESLSQRFRSLRFRALQILAEIDSPKVIALTDLFPNGDRYDSWLQARFRNGDLGAGLSLLTLFDSLDVTVPGRPELLAHVFARFGSNIIEPLLKLLCDQGLDSRNRKGCLLLAGYRGTPALAQAIHTSWANEESAEHLLKEYLWAAARCLDGNETNTLVQICDLWAELPDKEEDSVRVSRSDFAAHGISWEFRRYLPIAAIPYFVERANTDERLSWQITYMMRDFDHPVAVEHVARFLANRDRNRQPDTFDIAHHALLDGWERQQRKQGVAMSSASKARLLALALDPENDVPLRKSAFRVWEAAESPGDIDRIRGIDRTSDLYERAIWARARRKDKTVIPQLVELMPSNPRYWWQTGRYLWSAEMTEELHRSIKSVADRLKLQHDSRGEVEWILSERLMEIEQQSAERILLQEWEGLKYSPRFVQAALYFATPKLTNMANEVIKQSCEPAKFFEHITMHMGWMMQGRTGITRFEQVKLLCEYADYLSEHDIYSLWEICNKQGWADFRKTHLDVRLAQTEHFGKRFGKAIDFSGFDEELGGKRIGSTSFWVDHHIHDGHTLPELMDGLFDWLERNRTLSALHVLADIFYTSARRCDLERLVEYTGSWPETKELMADLAFAVQYRTLN